MRTKALFLAVTALLGVMSLASAPARAQKERLGIIRAVAPLVVTVYTYDAEGRLLAQGSGFFTGDGGSFITALHLFRGAVSGEVFTVEGEKLPIESVLAADKWSDLALLSTGGSPPSVPAPSLNFASPRIGEEVLVVGGSLVQDRSLIDTTVQTVRQVPYAGEIMRLTDWAPAGSIGGPVVNGRGEVVGIIAHPFMARNGNLAVGADATGRIRPGDARPLGSLGTRDGDMLDGNTYRGSLGALWEGEYEEALTQLLAVLETSPDDIDAAFLAGFCLNRIGWHHSASRLLRSVTKARPDDIESRFQLGLAYSKLGCFQDAAEEYREIVRIAPHDLEARYKLSYAYSRLDWHQEAAETFREIVVMLCKSSSSDGSTCDAMAGGQAEEIIDTYRRYIWTDNGEADIHYQRGLAFLTLARTDLAMQEYRALKKRNAYQAARLYHLIRK